MQEKLKGNIYFWYEKEIEYLLAAIELLVSFDVNPKIHEVYSCEFVEEKKKSYPLLFEFFANMQKEYGIEWLEFLLETELTQFQIEGYFSYIKCLPKEKFLETLLQMPPKEIVEALDSEQGQLVLYQNNKEVFQSYFVIQTLFHNSDWLIDSLEAFVLELRTEEAQKYLCAYEREILEWKVKMQEELQQKDGLTYSESLMGKSFHNRGPFEEFYFVPSIFMPIRCCRWFESKQIMIFDAIRLGQQDNQMIADALKMLSDKTRYQILQLLKERKSMNGIEIAEQMKLAPSTVSHHMNHLKKSGLVHEEPAGNTKYYSINTHCMKNCIETLAKTFL